MIPARFQQRWVPTRFREPPRMRTHSLDILPGLCHRFRTGTRLRNNNFQEAQPRFQRTRVLTRFRGSGNNPGVGYTPWVVPRFMLRTRSQKTNLQETKVPGPKGPSQRAIADREGDSVTINQRVSGPETQGFNIRCGLRQGSGNEGSRKTRFQGHKVPGTQGIPEIPQPIMDALWAPH